MRKAVKGDDGRQPEQSTDSFARQTKENYRIALEKQIEEGRRFKAEEKKRKKEEDMAEEARIQRDLERISGREQEMRQTKGYRDVFAPSLPDGIAKAQYNKTPSQKQFEKLQVNCHLLLAASIN